MKKFEIEMGWKRIMVTFYEKMICSHFLMFFVRSASLTMALLDISRKMFFSHLTTYIFIAFGKQFQMWNVFLKKSDLRQKRYHGKITLTKVFKISELDCSWYVFALNGRKNAKMEVFVFHVEWMKFWLNKEKFVWTSRFLLFTR